MPQFAPTIEQLQPQTPEPPPPAPAPELPTVEEAAAARGGKDTPVPIVGCPFNQDDVLQVIDPQSRQYGMFFVLGDVRHGKAHGYYLQEGGKREFITIPLERDGNVCLWFVGRSKVRSRVACSPKWISDNR